MNVLLFTRENNFVIFFFIFVVSSITEFQIIYIQVVDYPDVECVIVQQHRKYNGLRKPRRTRAQTHSHTQAHAYICPHMCVCIS